MNSPKMTNDLARDLALEIDAPDARALENEVRTLADLEMVLVGGGDGIPVW